MLAHPACLDAVYLCLMAAPMTLEVLEHMRTGMLSHMLADKDACREVAAA